MFTILSGILRVTTIIHDSHFTLLLHAGLKLRLLDMKYVLDFKKNMKNVLFSFNNTFHLLSDNISTSFQFKFIIAIVGLCTYMSGDTEYTSDVSNYNSNWY